MNTCDRAIVFHGDDGEYEMLVSLSWLQSVMWDWWFAAHDEWGSDG